MWLGNQKRLQYPQSEQRECRTGAGDTYIEGGEKQKKHGIKKGGERLFEFS